MSICCGVARVMRPMAKGKPLVLEYYRYGNRGQVQLFCPRESVQVALQGVAGQSCGCRDLVHRLVGWY